jgi:hypothetical protein
MMLLSFGDASRDPWDSGGAIQPGRRAFPEGGISLRYAA